MKRILILIFLLIPIIANANDKLQNACNFFHEDLAHVPNNSVVLNTGQLHSRFDGQAFNGCEVVFNSHGILLKNGSADLPSFRATKDSTLYEDGWREENRYAADGPGSGTYGIVKDNILCIINWDQHSWIDDKTGNIEHSDFINMVVQCMEVQLSLDK